MKAGNVRAPANVGCEKEDRDPPFTVRPKVKTKMAPSRKKKENKRTCKNESQEERKAGPESEVALVSYARCPSCGVQYPNSCSCPPHSPAQPDQPSPVPHVRISCTDSKSHPVCQKGTKVPPKTVHKTPRSSRDPHRFPRSLLVKIDLGLLSKVLPVSRNHQESLCREKKEASAAKACERRSGGAAGGQKVGKSGKKSHNVRDENQLIQSGLSVRSGSSLSSCLSGQGGPQGCSQEEAAAGSPGPSQSRVWKAEVGPRLGATLLVRLSFFIHSGFLGSPRSSRGSVGGQQRKKKARKDLEQQHSAAKKAPKDRPAAAGFTETNKSSCKRKTKDSRKHKGGGGKPPERPPQSDKVT